MARAAAATRPPDLQGGRVELAHGAGGRTTAALVEALFVAAFDNAELSAGDDAALLDLPAGRVVVTTDAFVVSPLFFPGGDIGRLAVCGTVNDLAMGGARPRHLTAAFVLEEGLPLADLARVVRSMAEAAREAGVTIVAGDTKVVERGKGDGVYVATAGIGVVPPGRTPPGGARARPGDVVLVSGPVGDHGAAILSCREGLSFATPIGSDAAPLGGLVEAMYAAIPEIRCLRDPTRGGLAATVNELAAQSGVGIGLHEASVPVRRETRAACELLGLDPWDLANEGRLVAIVAPEHAAAALTALRAHPLGVGAARIGEVVADPAGLVTATTAFGTRRVVRWLAADPLPRIC